MTTPSPLEQTASEINSLQSRISQLQDGVRLKATLDSVEDLQTNVNAMQQRVSGLRTRGYVFEKDLEGQAADFARQWSSIHPTLLAQINSQSASLQSSLRSFENDMARLNGLTANPAAAAPLINLLNSNLGMLEDQVRSAQSTIEGMYNAFGSEAGKFKSHLNELDYLLTQLSEARFSLLPTEGGIRAVKAVWCKDVKERDDDPEGVFYLTDQRLLFEQKEEVATKKILFITTAKQKVQDLKWQVPVALIDDIKTSKQGFLKNEDHLDIRFGDGGDLESAHLHIWQDANEWLQLLNRAKNKDFDTGRAVAIDQAVVAKVKTAPAQCPSCGANLGQVVLRGQDTIKCEYCGFVIRL